MKLILKTILLIILILLLILFFSIAIYVGFKFFSLLIKFILSGEILEFHFFVK